MSQLRWTWGKRIILIQSISLDFESHVFEKLWLLTTKIFFLRVWTTLLSLSYKDKLHFYTLVRVLNQKTTTRKVWLIEMEE